MKNSGTREQKGFNDNNGPSRSINKIITMTQMESFSPVLNLAIAWHSVLFHVITVLAQNSLLVDKSS